MQTERLENISINLCKRLLAESHKIMYTLSHLTYNISSLRYILSSDTGYTYHLCDFLH